jgi:hypothetical protein
VHGAVVAYVKVRPERALEHPTDLRDDPAVRWSLGAHGYELPVEQLEVIVLVEDPGLDHLQDLGDGEPPGRGPTLTGV